MADIFPGVVASIEDERKFVIRATIPNLIEEVMAYPIDTFDKAEEGDPIILYRLETIFGYSWMYQKMRLNEKTELHFGDAQINITSSQDDATQAEIEIKNAKVTIKIDKDGNIIMNNEGDIKIDCNNAEIKSNGDTKIEATGNCDVKGAQVKVDGSMVQITGGNLQINGTVSPSNGPFCALPKCLFTGAHHGGNIVSGT